MRIFAALLLFCLTAFAVCPEVAYADNHRRARDAVNAGDVLPLSAVLGIVRSQFSGRVMDVDLQQRGQSMVYQVKLLTPDGRLMRISVDARTGRIGSVKGGSRKRKK
ncbi:MAG: PepSY domain-containing protein [Alphaproteobacteria bacterium]